MLLPLSAWQLSLPYWSLDFTVELVPVTGIEQSHHGRSNGVHLHYLLC